MTCGYVEASSGPVQTGFRADEFVDVVASRTAPNDPTLSDGDFGGFIYAPCAEYVAQCGTRPFCIV